MIQHHDLKTSSDKSIAFFMPYLGGGGAERVMVNLANGFSQKGLNVDFVLSRAEGPYLDKVSPNINIVDLGARRLARCPLRLHKYLRESPPDMVISALDDANVILLATKLLTRKPVKTLITLHNTISQKKASANNWLQTNILLFLIKKLYMKSEKVVAVSNGVADDYCQLFEFERSAIDVIYNPVINDALYEQAKERVAHPWFRPNAPPVLLTIGRLSIQKNHKLLLRSFARLRKERLVNLLILGEGELRRELEDEVETLGLKDCVSLPGFVDNPYKFLANASGFVLSSDWEGLPTVLIEAVALGVPVVSTNCKSGPDEILQNVRNGTLVDVGDEHALYQGMRNMLATFAGREGRQGPLDVVEQYRECGVSSRYLEAIMEM